jgi:hypothetical protein
MFLSQGNAPECRPKRRLDKRLKNSCFWPTDLKNGFDVNKERLHRIPKMTTPEHTFKDRPWPITIVEINAPHVPPMREPTEPPLRTFEDVWEKDARWLLGPNVLASIVEHLRGKSLDASFQGHTLQISVPLPNVHDEISSSSRSILWTIPEELRSIFQECLYEIGRCTGDAEALLDLMNSDQKMWEANQATMAFVKSWLRTREDERKAHRWPELWMIAARVFGLHPFALPKPAFHCQDLDN